MATVMGKPLGLGEGMMASKEQLIEQAAHLASSSRVRLEAVLPGTEHADPEVAAAFVRVLWQLPCEATFQRLMALSARGNPPEVLEAAAYALGRYVWSGMQLDPDLDEEFGFAENVTEAQVEAVRRRLHDLEGDPEIILEARREALRSLAFDPDDATVARIDALFRSDRLDERILALECMGRAGLRRWAQDLIAILDADDEALLEAAIRAVGDACLEAAEARVVALTHDSRPGVALAAVWALRNVAATSRGRHRLFELLEEDDAAMASKAREAIMVLDGLEEGDVLEE